MEVEMRTHIKEFIRQDVRCDIHGDLYGVTRAADAIATYMYTEIMSRLERELGRAHGSYGDGLYEATEIVKGLFKEKCDDL
jgi:cytoplasmic iron level regulating protein YaaA (DUF328/UPF0246 family)